MKLHKKFATKNFKRNFENPLHFVGHSGIISKGKQASSCWCDWHLKSEI